MLEKREGRYDGSHLSHPVTVEAEAGASKFKAKYDSSLKKSEKEENTCFNCFKSPAADFSSCAVGFGGARTYPSLQSSSLLVLGDMAFRRHVVSTSAFQLKAVHIVSA